ncbi:MAG TPA: hypothetical protein VGC14_02665 [Rhizobium sp.]
MLTIPLQAIPNQTVTVTLDDQVCQINLYQCSEAMFIDLLVENSLIVGGVICENQNRIVRSDYLGFSGDIAFVDTQGSDDPIYTGLGTRFFLTYLTAAELAA